MSTLEDTQRDAGAAMEIACRQLAADQARSYQLELFEFAKKNNTIVVLGTGTGKTFISVLLIKHFEHQVAGNWATEADSKRTVFLAPTVPLVEQQAAVLRHHLTVKVGHLVGAMGVDLWKPSDWEERLKQFGVLVMTPEVLRTALSHGFMPLERINLLVFDECHKATGDHAYGAILKLYKDIPSNKRPRVLGLTASVVNEQVRGSLKVVKLIRHLELTMFATAKTVTGTDMFGTKPTEIIAVHDNNDKDNTLPVDNDLLNSLAKCADFKEFKKSMNGLRQLYETCGRYCAKQLLRFREKELSKALASADCSTGFKAHADTKRKIFQQIYDFLGENDDPLDLPPKMKRLLNILEGFRELKNNKEKKEGDPGPLCGVVFVKERMTAYVLHKWMNALSANKSYKFINSSFVVGQSQSSYSHRENSESFQVNAKAQNKVLSNFRRGLYNLIFATSVIEEGVDVPVCNLIVRFDEPPDVRSYTQSKGRARAKPSLYVVLADKTNHKRISKLMENFQETEMLVMRACERQRQAPNILENIEALEDDPDLPAYVVGSARITAQTAVRLLYWYCQGFAGEPYANVFPNFDFDESSDGYVCRLTMPLITPLWREKITNTRPFVSKHKARVFVCLEMCRRLHQAGELTDSLLPRKRFERLHRLELPPRDEDAEQQLAEFEIKTSKKGTTRYVFPRAQTSALVTREEDLDDANQQLETYRLYVLYTRVVHWASTEQNWRDDKDLFNPSDHRTWIGILLQETLPENLPTFPIFTRSGEEEVNVVNAGLVSLSADDKYTAQRFHRYVFRKVLNIMDDSMYACRSFASPCLVAVDALAADNGIDGGFALNFDAMLSVGYHPLQRYDPFIYNEKLYKDAVVELLYHKNENLPRYSREFHTQIPTDEYESCYVRSTKAVDSSGTPLTPHSTGCLSYSKSESLADYFGKKQMRYRHSEVTSDNQPVLEVEPVQKRLEMLTPRYAERTKDAPSQEQRMKRIERYASDKYALPEFVIVHKLKSSIWRKATSVPSILHRLNCIALAEELRCRIVNETGLGRVQCCDSTEHWEPIRLEAASGDRSVQTGFREYGRLMTSESRQFDEQRLIDGMQLLDQPDLKTCRGPSPGGIMKALSTKGAHDLFNMERLELLGDAFLQVVATFAILDRHPWRETTRELTVLRQYQVSNRHLLYRAFEKNLTSFVNAMRFHARRSFLPPGFQAWDHEKHLFEPAFLRLFLDHYGNDGLKDLRFAKDYAIVLKHVHSMTEDERTIRLDKYGDKYVQDLPDRNTLTVKSFQDYKPKVAGDVVEALIGLYVEQCGPLGGLRLLKWLGLEFGSTTDSANFIDAFQLEFAALKETILPSDLAPFEHQLRHVQTKLGYTFKNKLLLLQALTHPSCRQHHLIEPNCRLAFIGEGLLDFLITVYIYRLNTKLDPGQLTDLRAALTNNQILAHAAVKNELHSSLLYANSKLFTTIRKYVDHIEEIGPRLNTVLGDWETEDLEEANVPSCLSRLLEALLGAVFLDSSKSLEQVWKIIVKIMGYEISVFSKHIPLSPVRELCLRFPGTSFLNTTVFSPNGDDLIEVTMCLKLPDDKIEVYKQQAETKKQAKIILAKRYLLRLEKEEQADEIKRHKEAGGDTDEERTIEDNLLISETLNSKYYRK